MVAPTYKSRHTAPPPISLAQPERVVQWTLDDVHTHLEYAVNLELWTIPYYLSVMYSIRDASDPAFRLVQSVVNEEMLHAELAANVYNSFQPTRPLRLGPFHYTREGGVPHLNFALDPVAIRKYGAPDARLGGLDLPRVSTMCLIELPEAHPPDLDPHRESYATIGDFYTALRYGMSEHASDVRGNRRQHDYFGNFYRDLSHTTVTADGAAGLTQALELVDVITEQGEGRTNTDEDIPADYRNTADGYDSSFSHFRKFNAIRDDLLSGRGPDTYVADPARTDDEPLRVLAENFAELIRSVQEMFNGVRRHRAAHDGDDGIPFGGLMPTVGANVLTCWRSGLVPRFSNTRSMA